MMNIAMIGHKKIPSREGGIEIVVTELATRLVNDGNTVTCYNRKCNNPAGKKYNKTDYAKEYNGVHLVWIPTPESKKLNAIIYSFFATIKAVFSRCDVIHFHAEGPSAMVGLAKLFGKKCIVTIHGLDWQRAKWGGFATKFLLYGEKQAAKHADQIIVLSESVKDYFMQTYNRKTVFIPNGITEVKKRSDSIIKSKYSIEKDSYILYLGRIVPEKGIDCLIDAYNTLNTDKKLVIAGGSSHTDSYFNALKEKASKNSNIIFTDFVEGEELESLYSNCYIYCLPSELEGMPISLLEAMSCGCCCVTSDIDECTSVTGSRAMSFAKGDFRELGGILQKLCDDESTVDSYRKISAPYIKARFNWNDVTEKTIKVYNQALTGVKKNENSNG